ncbi:hypothetical protein LIER_22398 [Lithospermum erythrorhizon]|uniref:Integrase catalytic domain-containing protein n=1 Tax=Lithospermum erythrorhizon TaxID=34254 RepID=A0AAV3QTX0_LITER
MYDDELYKKSWDASLLRCTSQENIPKILAEVHQGWSGSHIGGRSLEVKITRTPRILVYDNGSQFESEVLDKFCEKYNIEHRFSPVYYPQCNCQVEVMNQILFKGIKKNLIQSISKKGAWVDELPVVLWSL